MAHIVYLALGTNLGDRLANLRAALGALQPKVTLLACSPVYETSPWGYLDQPNFLNQVVRGETSLSPLDLLDYLKKVEGDLGRQPSFQNGPRLIDLDILFYDDLVLEMAELTIPHPRLVGRGFILVPLAQLSPELRHPVLKRSVQDMMKDVDTSGIEWYFEGGCFEPDLNGSTRAVHQEVQ